MARLHSEEKTSRIERIKSGQFNNTFFQECLEDRYNLK